LLTTRFIDWNVYFLDNITRHWKKPLHWKKPFLWNRPKGCRVSTEKDLIDTLLLCLNIYVNIIII